MKQRSGWVGGGPKPQRAHGGNVMRRGRPDDEAAMGFDDGADGVPRRARLDRPNRFAVDVAPPRAPLPGASGMVPPAIQPGIPGAGGPLGIGTLPAPAMSPSLGAPIGAPAGGPPLGAPVGIGGAGGVPMPGVMGGGMGLPGTAIQPGRFGGAGTGAGGGLPLGRPMGFNKGGAVKKMPYAGGGKVEADLPQFVRERKDSGLRTMNAPLERIRTVDDILADQKKSNDANRYARGGSVKKEPPSDAMPEIPMAAAPAASKPKMPAGAGGGLGRLEKSQAQKRGDK